MKKFAVIFTLVFLFGLGLNSRIMAADEPDITIFMSKGVSSGGEEYDFEFNCDGGCDNVRKILFKVPNGKKMLFENVFGIEEFSLNVDVSYKEFKKRFPEGKYEFVLYPRKYGTLKVKITHGFPETPEITYPEDGDTDIPLDSTITWEPLSDIDDLDLYIEGGDDEDNNGAVDFNVDLPINTSSFSIPSGLLKPNNEYKLHLAAELIDEKGNKSLTTVRRITFTTGDE